MEIDAWNGYLQNYYEYKKDCCKTLKLELLICKNSLFGIEALTNLTNF